jgi:Methyltransferase FkbM domain
MLATLRLISPVSAINVHKLRVGGAADGGYVMLDDLDRIGVCYSLGVGPDVSWDLEMARRGALIYQYDHTVQQAPSSHPRFKHFQIGITHDESLNPALKRLDTLIRENGHSHRHDMVLKVDIEGHEWDSLDALDPSIFLHFRQIVIEFHGLRMLNIVSFQQRAHRLFAKLREHHEVIHVHGNNFAGIPVVEGIPVPDCIELSYANRRYYSFFPSNEIFPGPLDTANNSNMPDLFLGSFKF